MNKPRVFHPYLFGIFPVLSLYAANFDRLVPSVITIPALVITAATALMLYAVNRFVKDLNRTGIYVSLFLLFFFSYGHFSEFLMKFKIGDFVFFRQIYRGPLYIGLYLLIQMGAVLMLRRFSDSRKAVSTRLANVVAASLIIFSASYIGLLAVKNMGGEKKTEGTPLSEIAKHNEATLVKPDIYYIVLDGYAANSTLKKYFDFDNSEFINFLESRGFYVPQKSRSNYALTMLSLSVISNMDYYQTGERDGRLGKNPATNFLASQGYKYIDISSLRYGDEKNRVMHKGIVDEFLVLLSNTTIVEIVARRLNIYAPYFRRQTLFGFDQLENAISAEGPKFVFAYILAPHPPYVFGPNGEPAKWLSTGAVLNPLNTPWDDKQGYLNQVKFVNKRIRHFVETVFEISKEKPIIILQADHGPKIKLSKEELRRVTMRIFSAYYLPGGADGFYPGLTPVNVLRKVFNQYLGADFPILEDRSYYSYVSEPYDFIDVTDELTEEGQ